MRYTVFPLFVGLFVFGMAPYKIFADNAAHLSSAAAAYSQRIQAGLAALVPLLPDYVRAAEAAALRLASGGRLWLAGDRGFVLEGLHRAGGLMSAQALPPLPSLQPNDVLLYGLISPPQAGDITLWRQARTKNALCVILGPRALSLPAEAGIFLAVPTPPADNPVALPTASPLLAAALWTFTGELVAAWTRLGKMPTLYQSVLVPGGRERNAVRQGQMWEPFSVPPILPYRLGRTYLARVSHILRTLRATQLEKFHLAGQLAAQALQAGRTAWLVTAGHLPPELPGQIGDPGILRPLKRREPDRLQELVQSGDVIFYVGYFEPFGPWPQEAHKLGAKIVTIVSGTPERPAEAMGADINLNGCWPYGDSLVDVPGYDIKILPASGVIQATALWMLVAETVQHFSAQKLSE